MQAISKLMEEHDFVQEHEEWEARVKAYMARTFFNITLNGPVCAIVIDGTPVPRIDVQECRVLIWIVLESEHHAILEVWRIFHVQLQEHIFTALSGSVFVYVSSPTLSCLMAL